VRSIDLVLELLPVVGLENATPEQALQWGFLGRCTMRNPFIVLGLVGILSTLLTPAVSASPRNGELCSIQSYDESVVASVYRKTFGPASQATPLELTRAGQWCTDQAATPGWAGADKNFDDYVGQSDVCMLDAPTEPINIVIASVASAHDEAVANCWNVLGEGDPSDLTWLDGTR
jgi:hypothetical protein